MAYKHHWNEYDIDSDEELNEYLQLLDKIKNNPDKFGIVSDKEISWKNNNKTEFRQQIVWWELNGTEINNKH
jgi:hypothetical protein